MSAGELILDRHRFRRRVVVLCAIEPVPDALHHLVGTFLQFGLVGDYQDARLGMRPKTAFVLRSFLVYVPVRIRSQQDHGSVCQVRESLVDLGDLAGRVSVSMVEFVSSCLFIRLSFRIYIFYSKIDFRTILRYSYKTSEDTLKFLQV